MTHTTKRTSPIQSRRAESVRPDVRQKILRASTPLMAFYGDRVVDAPSIDPVMTFRTRQ